MCPRASRGVSAGAPSADSPRAARRLQSRQEQTQPRKDDVILSIHMGEDGPRRIITVDPPEPATEPEPAETPAVTPQEEPVPA